ncbi:MAG: hypothetical protein RLZ55_758 [Actinomycetota bacterium]
MRSEQDLGVVAEQAQRLVDVLDQASASRILAPRSVETLCRVCEAISAMHSALWSGR